MSWTSQHFFDAKPIDMVGVASGGRRTSQANPSAPAQVERQRHPEQEDQHDDQEAKSFLVDVVI